MEAVVRAVTQRASDGVSFEDAKAIRSTEKAVLVRIDDQEVWVPQSQIHDDSEVYRTGDEGTLVVKPWFAERMQIERPHTEQRSHDQAFKSIQLTHEQLAGFELAARKVRDLAGNSRLSPGQCLELICADFMAGN